MTSNPALAIAASAVAACLYAIASALQHRAARQAHSEHALNVRLLFRLFRDRGWLVGQVADTAGTGLQAVALGLGPLSLVQPIIAAGTLLAVPLDSALDRRRLARRSIAAVLVGTGGLVGFVIAAAPAEGAERADSATLLAASLACLAGVAGCLLLVRLLSQAWRGTLLGLATGIAFAGSGSLVKACIDLFGAHGAVRLLTDWPLYGLILLGALGLLLNQDAFQVRPLQPALLSITLSTPIVSSVIGVCAFGEQLAQTPIRITVAVLSAAAMVIGVLGSQLPEPPDRPAPPAPERPERPADVRPVNSSAQPFGASSTTGGPRP
jgi:drug/metabolite transporter (DMT)-like permease